MKLNLVIFAVVVILGYLYGYFFALSSFHFFKKLFRHTFLKSYHIHHSTAGLLIIMFSFFVRPMVLQIVIGGFGFGMLIHHMVSEGFIFITKN